MKKLSSELAGRTLFRQAVLESCGKVIEKQAQEHPHLGNPLLMASLLGLGGAGVGALTGRSTGSTLLGALAGVALGGYGVPALTKSKDVNDLIAKITRVSAMDTSKREQMKKTIEEMEQLRSKMPEKLDHSMLLKRLKLPSQLGISAGVGLGARGVSRSIAARKALASEMSTGPVELIKQLQRSTSGLLKPTRSAADIAQRIAKRKPIRHMTLSRFGKTVLPELTSVGKRELASVYREALAGSAKRLPKSTGRLPAILGSLGSAGLMLGLPAAMEYASIPSAARIQEALAEKSRLISELAREQ